jgi:hypothetical protein
MTITFHNNTLLLYLKLFYENENIPPCKIAGSLVKVDGKTSFKDFGSFGY